MSIVTHPPVKRQLKMVGAFMPPYIHEYITLYTLAKSTTKAKLLTSLVEPWILAQRSKEPDSELVDQVVRRIKMEWKVERITKKDATIEKFKETTKQVLTAKGIKQIYITRILNEI